MFASAPEISEEDFQFKNSPANDRIGFVRKVLGIVCAQLLITATISGLVMSNDIVTEAVQNTPGMLVFTCILSIISSIALICSKTLSRTVPYNYSVLLVFVFFM